MRPIGNNVLVQIDPVEEKLIIVRDLQIEASDTGTIVDVGAKVEELTQGDRVIFSDNFNNKKVPGHEGLTIMDQSAVLLIL